MIAPLEHGGNVCEAIQRYGGTDLDWLDLSTGISPWSYPIPDLNESLWRSLPAKPESLIHAAANYYGCQQNAISVTPGSQLAIRLIPTLINSKQTVAIPLIGYQEHAYAWRSTGHTVLRYTNIEELNSLICARKVDNVVVINPNNPSCETTTADELRSIASQISGLMIVDEAFSDLDNCNSLSRDNNLKNILVLRSIGKFFGLAGARIGFVITHNPIGEQLTRFLCPWSISGPAQFVAELALQDQPWQDEQRTIIISQSTQLKSLLRNFSTRLERPLQYSSIGLITTIFDNQTTIQRLHEHFAIDKIWTRINKTKVISPYSKSASYWLRLSLPGNHFNLLAESFNRISHS